MEGAVRIGLALERKGDGGGRGDGDGGVVDLANGHRAREAEGDAPAAAPKQHAPVQPEVVTEALETLDLEAAALAPATDQVKAAAEAVANIDTAPGLEELEMGASRISVDEKAMINCRADLIYVYCHRVINNVFDNRIVLLAYLFCCCSISK